MKTEALDKEKKSWREVRMGVMALLGPFHIPSEPAGCHPTALCPLRTGLGPPGLDGKEMGAAQLLCCSLSLCVPTALAPRSEHSPEVVSPLGSPVRGPSSLLGLPSELPWHLQPPGIAL